MWGGVGDLDDELLSWRSFDTTLGTDAAADSAPSEIASDVSDRDDLAELIDRSCTGPLRLSRHVPLTVQSGWASTSTSNAWSASDDSSQQQQQQQLNTHPWFSTSTATLSAMTTTVPRMTQSLDARHQNSMSRAHTNAPVITLRIERACESVPQVQSPRLEQAAELPSTSEMVHIVDSDTDALDGRGIRPDRQASMQQAAFRASLPPRKTSGSSSETFDWSSPVDRMVHDDHAIAQCRASPPPLRLDTHSLFPKPLEPHGYSDEYHHDRKIEHQRAPSGPAVPTFDAADPSQLQHCSLELRLATACTAPFDPHPNAREPMTLSQLLATPPSASSASQPQLPITNVAMPTRNYQQTDEQQIQAQLIQQLEAELEDRVAQHRLAMTEEHKWRERSAELETLVQRLQHALAEREHSGTDARQLLANKTAEVATLQTRCLALQDANESLIDQTKRAVEEKERVQRDYLQVVFDLGKAQKQLNAKSNEAATTAANEHLVREIDALLKANEALQQQVKMLERSAGASSAASESHQVVRRLRGQGAAVTTAAPLVQAPGHALPPPPAPSRVSPFVTSPANPLVGDSAYSNSAVAVTRDRASTSSSLASSLDLSGRGRGPSRPVQQQRAASEWSDARPGSRVDKQQSMSLKDMMAEQQQRLNYALPHQSSVNQPLTLASMGFTTTSTQPMYPSASTYTGRESLDSERFKTDAIARRITNGSASFEHDAPFAAAADNSSRSASFPPPATAVPFATERQSFQLDAGQRRHLEQRLMALQLEKEQTEAKAFKLEHAGLRSMSARSEKQWLDARVQTLTQDVSRLRLTLR